MVTLAYGECQRTLQLYLNNTKALRTWADWKVEQASSAFILESQVLRPEIATTQGWVRKGVQINYPRITHPALENNSCLSSERCVWFCWFAVSAR